MRMSAFSDNFISNGRQEKPALLPTLGCRRSPASAHPLDLTGDQARVTAPAIDLGAADVARRFERFWRKAGARSRRGA
jgi:hypothetical protein